MGWLRRLLRRLRRYQPASLREQIAAENRSRLLRNMVENRRLAVDGRLGETWVR